MGQAERASTSIATARGSRPSKRPLTPTTSTRRVQGATPTRSAALRSRAAPTRSRSASDAQLSCTRRSRGRRGRCRPQGRLMMMSKKPIPRAAMMLFGAAALVLSFASAGAGAHAPRLGLAAPPVGPCDPTITSCVSTIAFSSTRDHVSEGLTPLLLGAEVYLAEVMNPDTQTPTMTNLRRLTDNVYGDAFANLSPDGKKIVFDSNRLTAGTVCDGVTYYNISDLFLMNTDGTEQTLLTRGSSVTWSPDSKNVAFHASASYSASGGLVTGCPIRTDPGSATTDSDIFVANVDDLLARLEQPTNITNSPDWIDDDPDWSPDGQKIVFTSHPVTDDRQRSNQAELYLMNPDGTGLF